MSYVNINGKTVGPIQIGSNGPVISSKIIELQNNNGKEKIIEFSFNDNLLTVARAKTPLLGTYKDENGQNQPNCDPRSLATVEWVMAYSALPHEDRVIDLGIYVTLAEFERWKKDINNNTSSNASEILQLQQDLHTLQTTFDEWIKDIETLPDNLIINCGNATSTWY